MHLTLKQVNEVIDKILPSIAIDPSRDNFGELLFRRVKEINPTVDTKEEGDRVLRIMREEDLIRTTSTSCFLTENAKRILTEHRGWLNYIREIEKEEKIDKEMKRLSLKELKGNVFQVRFWWLLVIMAAIGGEVIEWIFEIIKKGL